jgi:periplasmic protein TonB
VNAALNIPSERAQYFLRWGVCFAVVLLVHALAVAKLLQQDDFPDEPPGPQAVVVDVAAEMVGDLQAERERVDPSPIKQDVKPEQEPEQKEAEVALAKEVQQPQPTPVEAPPQEEQVAKAPPKVSPEAVRKWQITVNTRLNQFKRYPEPARLKHQEGIATVVFTLDRTGHVISAEIVKSSGSAILDQETLDVLTRAQPFPVPPDGAGGQDLFLKVPISYAFRGPG